MAGVATPAYQTPRTRARGDSIAIITYQGGVALGFITEQACWNKLEQVVAALGLTYDGVTDEPTPPQLYVCMYDVRGKAPYNDPIQAARRKPSGTMLREAMHDYRHAARTGVLYVGDRPEDRAAAADAGVTFQFNGRMCSSVRNYQGPVPLSSFVGI